MKTKISLMALTAFFFVAVVSSCSKSIDARLDSMEKSIDNLEKSYKDMKPAEIETSINLIESQSDALEKREDDMTRTQQKKYANLEGRYHKLLIKIELYLMVNDLLDESEVETVIEYIKGLLSAN